MGLKIFRSWTLPCLWIGTTLATFQTSAKVQVVIDKFKIQVIEGAMAVAPKRNNLGEIPSSPTDFASFNLLSSSFTKFVDTSGISNFEIYINV